MDPFSIMLLVSLFGLGVQAVGAIKGGNAAKRAGEAGKRASDAQADLADYNASVADLQAADAIDRGKDEEGRFRLQVRGLIGSQRAGFGASNVDVGFGSAVDTQADAAFLGELDALTIRTNAAREAWGYQVQAEDLRRRGQIARQEGVYLEEAGRAERSASRIAAAGTIAAGTGSLLQARYGFGRRPVGAA